MSLVELIKEILLRKQYFRQKNFDNGHIIKQHTKFTINIKKKKQEINICVLHMLHPNWKRVSEYIELLLKFTH